MILTNRRLRLLYIALAGMDMAVLLPWLVSVSLFWARNGDLRAERNAGPGMTFTLSLPTPGGNS